MSFKTATNATGHLSVLKHSGYLFSAKLFSRLASLPFFIYAATKLGPSLFGILFFVMALVEILNSISDLGISRYGARAIVRKDMKIEHLAGIILSVRMLLGLILVAGTLIIIVALAPASPMFEVLLLGLLAVVLASFILVTETILTGVERFGISAVMQVFGKLTYITIAFALLWLGYSVVAVMLAFVISLFLEGLLRMIYTIRNVTSFSLHFTLKQATTVVLGTLPFAVTVIATIVYFRADTLILEFFRGANAVGIFGAAYTIYAFYVSIPIVFSRALLPRLTAYYKKDKDTGEQIAWFWYRITAVAGPPVIFISIVLSGFFIHALLPETFHASVITLQILLCSIPFMVATSVGITILIVVNREMTLARVTVATAVMIIVLDLAIIPFYGVNGAAAVMVATVALRWLVIYWLLSRYVWSGEHGVVRTLGIPIIGSALMIAAAVLVYPLGFSFSLLAGLAGYGVVFAAVYFRDPDDWGHA